MMNKIFKYVYVALLSLVALCLVSCSDDEPEEPKYPLELRSLGTVYQVPFVRTLPSGYTKYNTLYPSADPSYASIAVYLTQGKDAASKSGEFTYDGNNKWESSVAVKEENYYMYGFMPADGATGIVTYKGSSFAEGAVMTLTGLDAVTPADVCVIVGVYGGSSNADITEASVPIQPGAFAYHGKTQDNYVYLLLDHLYANMNFEYTVDATYSALRTIKLKKVEAESSLNGTINATITLAANGTGENPVTNVTYSTTSTTTEAKTLLNKASGEELTLSTSATSVPGYFTPVSTSGNLSFTITSTYDVYDRKGNLVRKDCSATNVITINTSSYPINRGSTYTIRMDVVPTYLYQLSEPDLNNPTIISSNI